MGVESHVKYSSSINLSSMWSTRVHGTQVPWKNLNGTWVPWTQVLHMELEFQKKKKKIAKSAFAITQCSKNQVSKLGYFSI